MADDMGMLLVIGGLAIGAFVLSQNPSILQNLTGGGAAAAPASGASSTTSASTTTSTAQTWTQDPAFPNLPCQTIGQACATAGQKGQGSNIWCLCGGSSSTPSTAGGQMVYNPTTGQYTTAGYPYPGGVPITTTLSPVDGGVILPGQVLPFPASFPPGATVIVDTGQRIPTGCQRVGNHTIVCQPGVDLKSHHH